MRTAIRTLALVYIAITAAFLGYLGTKWAFFPAEHMAGLGVETSTIPAINTLKSIMGTALLGVTGACILFLFNRQKWGDTLLLLIGIMLPVRVISLFVDGFHSRMTIYAVLELLILVAVITAVKLDQPKIEARVG